MKLTYRCCGDFLMPNIGIPEDDQHPLGKYNVDRSLIHLERKSKRNRLGSKDTADLSVVEAQAIVDGDLDWIPSSGCPLVQELYSKMKSGGLQPKTIVDNIREPFVYVPGNVRVTLDSFMRQPFFISSSQVASMYSGRVRLPVESSPPDSPLPVPPES